jgi:hypothetical protein
MSHTKVLRDQTNGSVTSAHYANEELAAVISKCQDTICHVMHTNCVIA